MSFSVRKEPRATYTATSGNDALPVSDRTGRWLKLLARPLPSATTVAFASATATTAGGGAVLLGYATRTPVLTTLGLGDRPLHPVAALLFILSGLYLFRAARPKPPQRMLRGFGIALGLLCVAALAFQLFGGVLPFTPPAQPADDGFTLIFSGPTNIALAVGFGCVALTIILLHGPPRASVWMILPLIPVFWTSYLAFAADFYRAERPSSYLAHTLFPLPAAVLFGMMIPGLIALQPRRGFMGAFNGRYLGSLLARATFPVILLTPFTIGWLRIRALKAWNLDVAAAYSQFSVTNILIFGTFIWLCSYMLNRIDARRLGIMESLRGANDELHRVNEELTRVNAALEAKIEEQARTEEARKRTELQLFQAQKMEAMGTLAAGIAHDFNNLLTVIMLNTENALDVAPEDSPLLAPLQEIRKSGGRAADVIRQIMTFGRKSHAGLQPVSLEDMAREAAELLRHSLPRHVTVRIRFAADVPPVLADATQVQQVLLNLGTNAGHAMAESGTLLDIAGEFMIFKEGGALPHPDLSAGEFVRVSVRDQGRGMDPETLEKIFDPFFTTKPPGKGTGLGLSVVHGIMQLHHGCVTAASEPGRGSDFHLYFPVAKSV